MTNRLEEIRKHRTYCEVSSNPNICQLGDDIDYLLALLEEKEKEKHQAFLDGREKCGQELKEYAKALELVCHSADTRCAEYWLERAQASCNKARGK